MCDIYCTTFSGEFTYIPEQPPRSRATSIVECKTLF